MPKSECDRWNHQRPPTRHTTPAPNGQGRSEYSANEKTGDTTEIKGARKPIHASQQGDFARTFATPRDLDYAIRRPGGARMRHHDTGGENHRLGDQGFMADQGGA